MFKLRKLRKFKHWLESYREQFFYGFPARKITIIGVTGTDGKTTTATLIHHILTSAGIKTGISSTLLTAHTTTPGRGAIHKFLAHCLRNGCSHAVIEVTSIGIDQLRVHGVKFDVGVLTNVANNEHLDYHGSFEQYRKAKIDWLLGCKTIVANADDDSIETIKSQVSSVKGGRKPVTYGIKNKADVTPKTLKYQTKLIGEFNTYNILAAGAACKALGVEDRVISGAIRTFEPPSGRLEIVVKKPFTVIVDFAHTPQAFEKVLPVARSFRKQSKSKLIHVFGATGDRDKSKRPLMGRIASRYDDIIVLTHEDTYSEDPKGIISQIESGIDTVKHNQLIDWSKGDQTGYLIINDRRKAIEVALKIAKPGDVVLLTGVGHQKSMNIGGKEVLWSEQKVVKELLNK